MSAATPADEIEIPAWCSAHDSIGRLFTDGSGSCIYTHIVEMERGECVLIPKRLVDPSALIVERDAAGNWPLSILDAIGEKVRVDPWLVQAVIEDALELSDTESCKAPEAST